MLAKSIKVLLFSLGITLLNIFRFGDNFFNPYLSFSLVFPSLVGGAIFGLSLLWIVPKITLSKKELFFLLWFLIFILQQLTNLIEGTFFTNTNFLTPFHLLNALFFTFVESLLAVFIFQSSKNYKPFLTLFKDYLKSRKPTSWFVRIIISSISYFPIYFFFGMLVSPFVVPIYRNPEFNLTIPPFSTIIPVELLRGLIYTLTFLPLFAVLKKGKWNSVVVILFLFIPGAFLPLLANTALPQEIVPFHMVEILGDSIVYGILLTKLLAKKVK